MDLPATWPPRPGDTWAGPHGTWHGRHEHGRLVLIPERTGWTSLYGGTLPGDVWDDFGPLALTHRPKMQPTDWELTLSDAGRGCGNGWYRFVLNRLAEQDPTDPMVSALWALVADHSGPDDDYCPGCDGGCCKAPPCGSRSASRPAPSPVSGHTTPTTTGCP